MPIDIENILIKLPSRWDDVSVKDFVKLSEINISETDDTEGLFIGADNTLSVLSVFANISVDELETLPMKDILRLSSKLDFIVTPPVIGDKNNIQWKKPDEITYNDFVLYQNFHDDFFKNIQILVPAFSKTQMSEEDVLNMSIVEANTAFFFYRKDVKKSLKRMKNYLRIKLMKQRMKEIIRQILY